MSGDRGAAPRPPILSERDKRRLNRQPKSVPSSGEKPAKSYPVGPVEVYSGGKNGTCLITSKVNSCGFFLPKKASGTGAMQLTLSPGFGGGASSVVGVVSPRITRVRVGERTVKTIPLGPETGKVAGGRLVAFTLPRLPRSLTVLGLNAQGKTISKLQLR